MAQTKAQLISNIIGNVSGGATFTGIVTTQGLVINGSVGIGTINPTSTLHLAGIGTTALTGDTNRIRIGDFHWDNVYTSIHAKKVRSEWWLEQNSNDDDGVDLIFYKTRGTPRAELPVQLGDNIFRLSGRAFRPNAVGVGSTISLSDWSDTAVIAFDVDQISGNNVLGRIDFRTQDISRMVVKASGNVGIGSTIPVGQLQVSSGPVIIAAASSTGTASQTLQVTGGAYVSGNLGVGFTNPTRKLEVGGETTQFPTSIFINRSTHATSIRAGLGLGGDWIVGTDNAGIGVRDFFLYSSSLGVAPFRIDTAGNLILNQAGAGSSTGTASQPLQVTGGAYVSGNLGIGTTNPAATLDVNGARIFHKLSGINTVEFGYGAGSGDTNVYGWYVPSGKTLQVYSNATFAYKVDSGNLLINTTSATGTTSQPLQVSGGGYFSGSVGIGTTRPTTTGSTLGVAGTITELYQGQYWNVVSQADVGIGASQVPLNQYLGQLAFVDEYSPNILLTPRIQSVGEKTNRISGNTASLTYNTGGGNIAICTNPTGDITLAVTGIPTTSDFDDTSLTFSVFVNQTGTARSCTAVTLNGLSATIRWAGGSLSNAISGVTTTSGVDIFSFTGINTVGSASTTSNYYVLGVVNGGYR